MSEYTARDERLIAEVIEAMGKLARTRIRRLPAHTQDLAWASVAAAIVGAAIHDSSDASRVVSMVSAIFVSMVSSADLLKVGNAIKADIGAMKG